jgi:hypothetical protein
MSKLRDVSERMVILLQGVLNYILRQGWARAALGNLHSYRNTIYQTLCGDFISTENVKKL